MTLVNKFGIVDVVTNFLQDVVQAARRVAERLHDGQFRRDGIEPYFRHPERAALAAAKDGQNCLVQAVIYLHDTIEDCQITDGDLLAALSDELRGSADCEYAIDGIVGSVLAMSRRKDEDYLEYLKRVRADAIARIAKIYDILDNLPTASKTAQTKYRLALAYLAADDISPAWFIRDISGLGDL